MRDPCLAEGPDGTFHLVWTSGWTAEKGKILGHVHSKDLMAWSEQEAIPVMENEPQDPQHLGARNLLRPNEAAVVALLVQHSAGQIRGDREYGG
jgi:hypothetical protein